MVGRGECKCLTTRGQWFQENELKEEVGERRSKNEGREAGECTTREHLRVAELIRVCRKGTPLNSGVHDGSASRRGFTRVQL
ncbi:hypothetical protein H5410_026538 [Solanum commersonii]|uniref:Uncharacterized protein n=1 Tax=Solanum commersonii TaxID=4109 RepID=A0A9J5Z1T4_SOLCO|nr:hypothetical protein H5410_026538 [Solanum commersonii]